MSPGATLLLLFSRGSTSVAARVPLEAALGQYFAADTGISALAGSRIFNGRIPEDQLDAVPALTFRVISRPPLLNLDGASGLVNARVQINTYGKDGVDGEALAFAASSSINRIPSTIFGLVIQSAWVDDGEAADDTLQEGSDSTRSDYRTDAFINYVEPPS